MSKYQSSKFSKQKSDLNSGDGGSTSRKGKKWGQFVKLKQIKIDAAVEGFGKTVNFMNQYETMSTLLDKLEGRAKSAMVLSETCKVIGKLAETMRSELPMHRDILLGGKKEDENVKQEEEVAITDGVGGEVSLEERQGILDRLEIGATVDGEISEQERRYSSGLEIDKDLVIKTFPLLESTIYKLGRRLRLVTPDSTGGNSAESKLMVYLAAIDLLPDINKKLKGLVSALEEIEFLGSKNEANLSEKVIALDQKILVEKVSEVLNEMQESEDAEMMGIGTEVYTILDMINTGHETLEKPAVILQNCKRTLERIVSCIADKCDEDIAEIQSGELRLGDWQFVDDFGDTYKGHYTSGDRTHVVFAKQVSFRKGLSAIARRELQVEVDSIRRLKHENLTEFLGTGVLTAGLHLVWEFYDRTLNLALFEDSTRREMAEQGFKFTNEKVIDFSCDILHALEYLHNSGVVHQDLTSKNVLIKDDMSGVCIGDFCFVDGKRELRNSSNNHEGDEKLEFETTYRAPETLLINNAYRGVVHVYASDIYSFAVLLFEMIEKRKAYQGLTYDQFKKKVFTKPIKRPNYSEATSAAVPKLMKDIITKCWQQKPELRPSATMLLEEFQFQREDVAENVADEPTEAAEGVNQSGDLAVTKREKDQAFKDWLGRVTDSTGNFEE